MTELQRKAKKHMMSLYPYRNWKPVTELNRNNGVRPGAALQIVGTPYAAIVRFSSTTLEPNEVKFYRECSKKEVENYCMGE